MRRDRSVRGPVAGRRCRRRAPARLAARPARSARRRAGRADADRDLKRDRSQTARPTASAAAPARDVPVARPLDSAGLSATPARARTARRVAAAAAPLELRWPRDASTIRLTRAPSLATQSTALLAHLLGPDRRRQREDPSLRVRSGTPEWWSATISHWSLKTGDPGRARRGVGLVVEEVLEQVDELVLAQRQLLRLAVRVLDDVDDSPMSTLPSSSIRAVPAELPELAPPASLGDRDQRVVEVRVGDEEGAGSRSNETDGKRPPSRPSW